MISTMELFPKSNTYNDVRASYYTPNLKKFLHYFTISHWVSSFDQMNIFGKNLNYIKTMVPIKAKHLNRGNNVVHVRDLSDECLNLSILIHSDRRPGLETVQLPVIQCFHL